MNSVATPVMKLGSDKSIQAWTCNVKETRILEKKIQTLTLEEDYAIKLLELSSRQVKVNNKRLKLRVSKIKSYLSPDEIKELRKLEMEGKLKPEYNQVKINGATRIAAAAKRLRLDGVVRSRCVTAPPRLMTPPLPAASMTVSRPSSAAGTLREQPTSSRSDLQKSLSGSNDDMTRLTPISRPATSHGFSRDLPIPLSARTPRCRSFRMEGPKSARSRTRSVYSSHSISARDNSTSVNTSQISPTTKNTGRLSRKLSIISDDSLDNNFNNNTMIEEHRQELLEQEQMRTDNLKEEQKRFLNKVETWVKENPSFHQEKRGSIEPLPVWTTRRKRQQSRVDFNQEREMLRNMSVEESWKDLNKCRYLRISDELVDLSGVVTLAKEQMKMMHSIRSRDKDDDKLE